MSDDDDHIRIWMQAELSKRPRGTKGKLAAHLGVRSDAITRMMNTDPHKETREIRASEHVKMLEFFKGADEAPDEVWSTVRLMGFVGAGAEVEPDFEQIPEDGLEQIEVPFALPEEMDAYQVRGDSMLPMFEDGMIIVVYREQRKSAEAFFGSRAIVRTSDGRRYIKTIIRGRSPGRVGLSSWNAQLIDDVTPVWIGEIFTYFPAASLRQESRRIGRQGGIQGRLELKTA